MNAHFDWTALTDLVVYDPTRPLLFNSPAFLGLFLLLYAIYLLLLRRPNLRIGYLLLFSIFFYYKSSGWYFLLLLFSIALNFGIGHLMHQARPLVLRRLYLFCCVTVNLGLLAYFKYANFLADTFNALTGSKLAFHDIFLPAGISFFTFQAMSYAIDVYRGSMPSMTEGRSGFAGMSRAFLDFAFYVSFFPQLVAGPIVRAADFIPQIRRQPQLSEGQLSQGLFLIMGGLFKKAVISDYISVNFVDRIFETPAMFSGFENLLGIYGYAIQIYCDFSGYSDMAIGLALLLGFQLNENFRTPYQSASIQEFWRRWHISLSTWLRDYLYISLGGNRGSRFRTYLNLMATMLLGGLWHGASWVFVIWGGLHGLALAFERFVDGLGFRKVNPAVRAFLLLAIVQMGIQTWLGFQVWKGGMAMDTFLSYTTGNMIILAVWTSFLLPALLFRSAALRRVVATAMTFHFVTFCWVLFRAGALSNPNPPLQTTSEVLGQIATAFNWAIIPQVIAGYSGVVGLIGLGFVLHFLPERWYQATERVFTQSPAIVKSLILALVIWVVIQTASSEVVPFIYFQF